MYDIKKLSQELKMIGLSAAEDTAKKMVEIVFKWIIESARSTPTLYDDMFIGVAELIKKEVMKELEKIDGK